MIFLYHRVELLPKLFASFRYHNFTLLLSSMHHLDKKKKTIPLFTRWINFESFFRFLSHQLESAGQLANIRGNNFNTSWKINIYIESSIFPKLITTVEYSTWFFFQHEISHFNIITFFDYLRAKSLKAETGLTFTRKDSERREWAKHKYIGRTLV